MKKLKVQFLARSTSYLECTKEVEIPDNVPENEIQDWLEQYGVDIGGEEYEEEDSDWDFSQAIIKKD